MALRHSDRVDDLPAPLDLAIFRQMADMSNEAFYLTDAAGRFRYVNERAVTLTGYARDELLSMTLFDLDPEFPREQFETIIAALKDMPLPPFEARTRRKDGSYHPSEASVARIDVAGSTYLFGVVRDLTEQKQMESAQKTFAQRILQTLEAERQRVARELHDDVGQAVATVGVLLHTLDQTPGSITADAQPALAAAHATLRQITESVARIVRDYHPADLIGLGLEDTLRAHAREFAHRHKLALRLATVPVTGLLSADAELHLYRIAQEALANVVRHARARHVTVRLARQRHRLVLTVRDDGVGFALRTPPGFGLTTMRERSDLMGGRLLVRSVPGRGTQLTVTVPFTLEPDGAAAVAATPPRRQSPRRAGVRAHRSSRSASLG